jgi:hypothetical protein
MTNKSHFFNPRTVSPMFHNTSRSGIANDYEQCNITFICYGSDSDNISFKLRITLNQVL